MLISRAILEEYLRVLAYPKLRLTNEEIKGLMEEEILPFVETVRVRRRFSVVRRDPMTTNSWNVQSLVAPSASSPAIETYWIY